MAKRQRTDRPCFLCEKAGSDCDGQRPCRRCVNMGIAHMCLGGDAKDMQAFDKNGGEGSSSCPLGAMTTPAQDTSRFPPEAMMSDDQFGQLQSIGAPELGQMTRNVSPAHPMRRALPHVSNEIAPAQHNMNTYILSEIRKLRDDNRRLHEDLLNLRLENLKIASMLPKEKRAQIFSTALLPDLREHTAIAYAIARGESFELGKDKPMLIFDLQNHPPTVLAANELFCAMLGYTMEEVIGAPWQKFVHEDYIERTMHSLSQRADSPTIPIEQIYRYKDGTLLATYDVHTILHDNAGNFIADTVTITPYPGTSDAFGPRAIRFHDQASGSGDVSAMNTSDDNPWMYAAGSSTGSGQGINSSFPFDSLNRSGDAVPLPLFDDADSVVLDGERNDLADDAMDFILESPK